MSKATTAVVSLLILASTGVLPVSLQAQVAAHFSGAQSPVGGGLASPGGVAVDASGNIYIADGAGPRPNKLFVKTTSAFGDGDGFSENPLILKKSFESRSRYEAGAHNYVQS